MSDHGWPYAQVDRVRFADLDARGHLNNVALIEFFEASRILYLRRLFPELDPTEPSSRDVILASQHVDYRAPAGLDDELETRVRPVDIRHSSFRLCFEVRRSRDGTLIANGHGVYVGFNYRNGEAEPLDEELTARLSADASAAQM